jgi:hypothetical protein
VAGALAGRGSPFFVARQGHEPRERAGPPPGDDDDGTEYRPPDGEMLVVATAERGEFAAYRVCAMPGGGVKVAAEEVSSWVPPVRKELTWDETKEQSSSTFRTVACSQTGHVFATSLARDLLIWGVAFSPARSTHAAEPRRRTALNVARVSGRNGREARDVDAVDGRVRKEKN